MSDPDVLRRAAEILRARSSKPNSVAMRALVNVLCEQAAKLEAGH